MGLLLNPISFRIGHFRSWSDAWYMHRIYYSLFFHNVLLIKTLFYFLMHKFFPKRESKWVYSHFNLYIFQNKIYLNIYIYSTFSASLWNKNWFKLFLKNKPFIKLRLYSDWVKKNLFNYDKRVLYWFLVMSIMNIYIETLELENLKSKYGFKNLLWMWNLKYKKYKERKKTFMVKEHLIILKRTLILMKQVFNKMESGFLWAYYSNMYKKKLKFFKFNINSTFLLKKLEKWVDFYRLKGDYTFLFYILSFFQFVWKRYGTNYPKVFFSLKILKNFMKFFFSWFYIRPVFISFSKYLKIFVLKFGYFVFPKMLLLNNFSVSADFICKYMTLAMRKRFSFKDMVIPLKKMLGRVMFFKLATRKNLDMMKNVSKNYKYGVKDNFEKKLKYIYNYIYKIDYLLLWKKLLDFKTKFKFITTKKNYKRNIYSLVYFKFTKNLKYISDNFPSYFIKIKNYKFINDSKSLKKNNFEILKYDFYKLCLYFLKYFYIFFSNNNIFFIFYFIILNYFKELEIKDFFYFIFYNYYKLKLKFIYLYINFKNIIFFWIKLKEVLNFYFLVFFYKNIFIRLYYCLKDFQKILLNNFVLKKYKFNKKFIIWNIMNNGTIFNNNNNFNYYLNHKTNNILKKLKKINLKKKKDINLLKILRLNFLKLKKKNLLYLSKLKYVNFYYKNLLRKNLLKKNISLNLNLQQYIMYLKNNLKLYSKKLKNKKKIFIKKKKLLKKKNYLLKKNIFFMIKNKSLMNFSYFFSINKIFLIDDLEITFPFFFNLWNFLNYTKKLKNYDFFSFKYSKNLLKNEFFNKRLEEKKKTLADKNTKFNLYTKNIPFLLGYKFAFNGRFSRKQRSSSFWYIRGANPLSFMEKNVEIGLGHLTLINSKCSIKVWLYKQKNSPKFFLKF